MFSVPDRSVWGSSLSAGQGVTFLKHTVLKAQNLWHTHCWVKTGPLAYMFDIPATDEISFAILLLNRLTIWTSGLLQGNKPSPFLFRKTSCKLFHKEAKTYFFLSCLICCSVFFFFLYIHNLLETGFYNRELDRGFLPLFIINCGILNSSATVLYYPSKHVWTNPSKYFISNCF